MQTNELKLFLHGQLAATLDLRPAGGFGIAGRGPAFAWLSSQWDGSEHESHIRNWLPCCFPENGRLEGWQSNTINALRTYLPHVPREASSVAVAWAHAGSEYPGALSLESVVQPSAGEGPVRIEDYPLVETDRISGLLAQSVRAAGGVKGNRSDARGQPSVSLSGIRPKTALTKDGLGRWRQAPSGSLNTWIVKVEDSHANPGEAGIEAICQRALRMAGVRAAETSSAVLGGFQCVLSRRYDRVVADGRVSPVHQEDFRQASGWGTPRYYDGLPKEPHWPDAYAVIKRHAANPDAECHMLTKLIAGAWMLGHGDFHRGNLGFRISAMAEGPKRVSVAAAYDVSSAVGTDFSKDLVFPVGSQRAGHKIARPQWNGHAQACRVDPDLVIDAVDEMTARLPEAFAEARRAARALDGNREQGTVDVRAEETQRHVEARVRGYGLARRRASGPRHRRPSPGGP